MSSEDIWTWRDGFQVGIINRSRYTVLVVSWQFVESCARCATVNVLRTLHLPPYNPSFYPIVGTTAACLGYLFIYICMYILIRTNDCINIIHCCDPREGFMRAFDRKTRGNTYRITAARCEGTDGRTCTIYIYRDSYTACNGDQWDRDDGWRRGVAVYETAGNGFF